MRDERRTRQTFGTLVSVEVNGDEVRCFFESRPDAAGLQSAFGELVRGLDAELLFVEEDAMPFAEFSAQVRDSSGDVWGVDFEFVSVPAVVNVY